MMQITNKKLLILVATHKPCVLPTEQIYLPIHCGKSVSKLDPISQKWMNTHTIGDNTGENISHLNPYFCELTALYWAWKNYEQLGAPEKIGLCHYRRFFMEIEESKITVPVHYLNKTIREQFNQYHNSYELSQAIDFLPNPELKEYTNRYLDQKKGYFFNMFVLPKEIFFEYCEILFITLFKLWEKSSWENLNPYQRRMPGFIAERLTGGFLYYLNHCRHIPIHETLTILPLFKSYNHVKLQTNFIALMAKHFPSFPKMYSLFLSAQTHFLKD